MQSSALLTLVLLNKNDILFPMYLVALQYERGLLESYPL